MCTGRESCVIVKNEGLKRIEGEEFSECRVPSSLHVPDGVQTISDNCFTECCSVDRLLFQSGESFRQFVRDSTLDEALERLGLDEISSLFGIEIEDTRVYFELPGCSSVTDES
jgi:hypothetical protein